MGIGIAHSLDISKSCGSYSQHHHRKFVPRTFRGQPPYEVGPDSVRNPHGHGGPWVGPGSLGWTLGLSEVGTKCRYEVCPLCKKWTSETIHQICQIAPCHNIKIVRASAAELTTCTSNKNSDFPSLTSRAR